MNRTALITILSATVIAVVIVIAVVAFTDSHGSMNHPMPDGSTMPSGSMTGM